MASANPARVLGEATRGTIQPGARADLVVLSPTGDVINSFVGGAPAKA
jgi:N-acetylglucosamine-6-phosphate deacetylase